MKRYIKKASVMGVALAMFLLVGVVFAAWVVSGTGNGYSKAKQAQDLYTDTGVTTTAQLYPGADGDVEMTIRNPNPFPVQVTEVAGNGLIKSDKGAACDASTGVTYTDQTLSANNVVPAASSGVDGSLSVTLTNAVHMGSGSDTTCQGAVFTIPVTFTAATL